MEDSRAIGRWLMACCLVLFVLVVVGGATRLTGSGLSIVDWRPVTGMVPPMSTEVWLSEFEKYRQSPEYQKVNRGMSLDEFKRIYWWEWGHRQLARFLGLIFAVPLIWFWVRRRIPQALRWPLVGILGLGALQGWMGWYMVSSGLVDIPRVSPYRLAAHLSLALIIFAAMFWIALRCLWPNAHKGTALTRGGRRAVLTVLSLLVVTILSGAFVAGLKAGYVYNTFPLMGGRIIPEGILYLSPWWLNFFENPATVQFTHRLLGIGTLLLAVGLWGWSLRQSLPRALQLGFHALVILALMQATLGITTLLMHVPVSLGTAHQGGAVLLLASVLALAHLARK